MSLANQSPARLAVFIESLAKAAAHPTDEARVDALCETVRFALDADFVLVGLHPKLTTEGVLGSPGGSEAEGASWVVLDGIAQGDDFRREAESGLTASIQRGRVLRVPARLKASLAAGKLKGLEPSSLGLGEAQSGQGGEPGLAQYLGAAIQSGQLGIQVRRLSSVRERPFRGFLMVGKRKGGDGAEGTSADMSARLGNQVEMQLGSESEDRISGESLLMLAADRIWLELHQTTEPAVPALAGADSETSAKLSDETRYRRFIDSTSEAIWCLELPEPIPVHVNPVEIATRLIEEGVFVEGNSIFSGRLGRHSVQGLSCRNAEGFWMLSDPARLTQLARDGFNAQELIVSELDRHGNVRHLSCGLFGAIDNMGLRSVWAIERDVTQQVEEQILLRQSEEFYKAISDTALDGICVLDQSLSIIDCNDAFAALAGKPRNELIESGVLDIRPVDGPSDDPVSFTAIAQQGRWRGEAVLVKKDAVGSGQAVRVELACRVTDAGRQRFFCFVRDLSERQSAAQRESDHQRALTHVARLSTLGEMTSGIAHELNQPLAAIVNYANGCTRIMESQGIQDPMIQKGLRSIAEQGKRAAEIIRRMRSYARRESDKREPFAVTDILSEAVEMSRPDLLRSGITIDTEYDLALNAVIVDGIQIEQVAINLIRNAVDAMLPIQRDHGLRNRDATSDAGDQTPKNQGPLKVTIRTQLALDETTGEPLSPRQVLVSIEDNGPGIPETVAARLFEPFFARGGEGIGLGLTISRSIIESHGGRLWFSPLKVGAAFHFTLPLRGAPIGA